MKEKPRPLSRLAALASPYLFRHRRKYARARFQQREASPDLLTPDTAPPPPPLLGPFPPATTPPVPPEPVVSIERMKKQNHLPKKPPKRKELAPRLDLIRNHLTPTLMTLWNHEPESLAFKHPVDPHELDLLDYHDVIKNPIDLSIIRKKLEDGAYSDPWEYVEDLWKIFDNAWLYNKNATRVYRFCTTLSEVAEKELTPVMRTLGYCCGRPYSFDPQPLRCFAKGKDKCIIEVDQQYHIYQEKFYTVCDDCFKEEPEKNAMWLQMSETDDVDRPTGSTASSSSQLLWVAKNKFEAKVNNVSEPERFLLCVAGCGRKLHEICVLHLETEKEPKGFTCDSCLQFTQKERPPTKFTAEQLPTSELGSFIETSLRQKVLDGVATGEVLIRVLSSAQMKLDVKPGMKTQLNYNGQTVDSFPYRLKILMAFQKIEGVEVLFFVMHAQEYGSDCPPPNTRRVYLAYLDSVHFFQPRNLRTKVYHHIVLSYLEFVKKLGFETAHIWACPPGKDESYIFHAHPPEQKVQTLIRLVEWYTKLLDEGVEQRVLLDHKNILEDVKERNLKSPAQLPYFDGDFWPLWLENAVARLEEGESSNYPDNKKQAEESVKKRIKFKGKAPPQPHQDPFLTMLKDGMRAHKEKFFVIYLAKTKTKSTTTSSTENPIRDPDPELSCDLINRDVFLTFQKDNNLEFSSLRRAKFSTMSLVYEIHKQLGLAPRFDEDDEDEEPPLLSPPQTISRRLDNHEDLHQRGKEFVRSLHVQDYIRDVIHAFRCKKIKCDAKPGCSKMKQILCHVKVCKERRTCQVCNKFLAYVLYHSKVCCKVGQNCPVPYCSQIKLKQGKVQGQQAEERLPQDADEDEVSSVISESHLESLTGTVLETSSNIGRNKWQELKTMAMIRSDPQLLNTFKGGGRGPGRS